MEELQGRTALVTGGTRGIGAAISRMYAERGMRVAMNYRSDDDSAQKLLESLPGTGHVLVKADIANPDEVQQMVNRAIEAFGRLHVLVNNAGIYELHPFFMESYEEWQEGWKRTLDVNLMSTVNATYCVLPHFKEQGGGKIISISSRGGFRGETEAPAYAVSKLGQVALTRCLARAVTKHNIYAYGIAPAWTDTDMSRHRILPQMERIMTETPYGRIATPEDVAGVALFLASNAADYLSGICVDVNGASYLH